MDAVRLCVCLSFDPQNFTFINTKKTSPDTGFYCDGTADAKDVSRQAEAYFIH